MKHIYESIPGWFSFPYFYSKIVREFPEGSRFVEIGTYKGRSFSYLVVEAFNSGKKFDIVGIDACPWPDVEPEFKANMAPLAGHFRTIFGRNSFDCAADFEDESIDVCFIDANHTYEYVIRDIRSFLPKMKKGGIIAGHDHNWQHPGVMQAVSEVFGDDFIYTTSEDTWEHQIK